MDDELVLLELREIETAIELDAVANSGRWRTFLQDRYMTRRLGIIVLVGVANQCAVSVLYCDQVHVLTLASPPACSSSLTHRAMVSAGPHLPADVD